MGTTAHWKLSNLLPWNKMRCGERLMADYIVFEEIMHLFKSYKILGERVPKDIQQNCKSTQSTSHVNSSYVCSFNQGVTFNPTRQPAVGIIWSHCIFNSHIGVLLLRLSFIFGIFRLSRCNKGARRQIVKQKASSHPNNKHQQWSRRYGLQMRFSKFVASIPAYFTHSDYICVRTYQLSAQPNSFHLACFRNDWVICIQANRIPSKI